MEPASSSNLAIFAFLILLPIAPCTALTPPSSPNLEGAGAIAPPPPEKPSSSFKPGVAVLVCILTTIFSLTFLLLLYIKHCNAGSIESPGSIAGGGNSTSRAVPPLSGRKNSGIDRSVVESLPVFRFGSLRGQKEGLDCAVCLTKFEAAEVLRLLPKCKHAFHVECVDTWLDAHSTCPLCRYRVDPEDILLIEETETKVFRESEGKEKEKEWDLERGRASAEQCGRRHSSVEEREREPERKSWTASFRRSLDSATSRKKSESVGCFVRARKDGMLLVNGETEEKERARRSVESKRLEHRIIVSGPGPGPGPGPERERGIRERWSDVEASELLYLTSEMIMSGRGIINSRSVSEITGLSRFSLTNHNHNHNHNHVNREQPPQQDGGREREEGLVRRWLAWISKSRTQPDVR